MKNCKTQRIVLNKYGEFFNVHLFPVHGMFLQFLRGQEWFHQQPQGKRDRVVALTRFFVSGKKGKQLADIYFSKENISIDTITHEAVHFAGGLLVCKKIKTVGLGNGNSRDEEHLALLTGQVAQRIADYLYSII